MGWEQLEMQDLENDGPSRRA